MDRRIFEGFAAQAAHEGKTLFQLTNEWLDLAAKISAEGGDAHETYKLWRSATVLREIDSVSLPSDFVDYMVGDLYAQNKERVLKSFSNLGANLVGLLKIVAPDIEGLSSLAKDLSIFIPIKMFDLQKTDAESIRLSIVGAGKRIESTECSFEFMKAILNGYGYVTISHELSVGTIRLFASRRGTI